MPGRPRTYSYSRTAGKKSEENTRALLQLLEQEVFRLGGAWGDSSQEAAHGRAALWEGRCHRLNRSRCLEEQLGLVRQRLSVKQSELRVAHYRACEGRNNRQCDECCLQGDVVLAPCFQLVCRQCFPRHMRCTSPYIYTGTDGERSFSERVSSLLDEISREVCTLQEGFWFTTSIWGKEYVDQDTCRLEQKCGWLGRQLTKTWREYERVISVLNSAHSKTILDRRNRPCEACRPYEGHTTIFREVYLAPCFHLVCRACYPDPGEELCKTCRAKPQGISATRPGGLPRLAV